MIPLHTRDVLFARACLFFLTLLPWPGFRPALPLLRIGAKLLRPSSRPVLESGRAPRRRHRVHERGGLCGERQESDDNIGRPSSQTAPPEASRGLPGPRRERDEQGIVDFFGAELWLWRSESFSRGARELSTPTLLVSGSGRLANAAMCRLTMLGDSGAAGVHGVVPALSECHRAKLQSCARHG